MHVHLSRPLRATSVSHLRTLSTGHNQSVVDEFSMQSSSFEAHAAKSTYKEATAFFLSRIPIERHHRVLDFATGTGLLARALSPMTKQVVGFDITAKMLEQAKSSAAAEAATNVEFVLGAPNADKLPFADAEFDLTMSRLALHHVESPEAILRDLARCTKVGGFVVSIDLVAHQNATVAAWHNALERLRDPSHTRALPLSEIVGAMEACGLQTSTCHAFDNTLSVERWFDLSQTHEPVRRVVTAALEEEAQSGASESTGMQPFWKGGELHFIHQWRCVVARKKK